MPTHSENKSNILAQHTVGSTEQEAANQVIYLHVLAEDPESDQVTKAQAVLFGRGLAADKVSQQSRDEWMRRAAALAARAA